MRSSVMEGVIVQEAESFPVKMKVHVAEQLRALEATVERQATGLDMAANLDSLSHSFEKLLKVDP